MPRRDPHCLTLLLHTDGAPVTKMGSKSLWPIQCTIAEIPPPIRDRIDATMVLGVWLGGSHPHRDLFWRDVVDQIRLLYNNGIIVENNEGQNFKFRVRCQLITFDLPALAHSCNIIQFNGYYGCPFCDLRGIAIQRQVFYPFSPTSSKLKTDKEYSRYSTNDRSILNNIGIKGPTPLTDILILPDQVALDYMHLVCSGHVKTLIGYWERILLPNVFAEASQYLTTVIIPHMFGYQFLPLAHYSQWKTKMFR